MNRSAVVVCFLAVAGWAVVCAGQTGAGSEVVGRIVDPSGAVVSGASLLLLNEATGFAISKASSPEGYVSFAYVPIGSYTLTAELKGFKTGKFFGIRVTLDQKVDLGDMRLDVGSVESQITVTEKSDRIDTSSPALRTTVTPQQMADMPVIMGLQGRSIQAVLLALTPGASDWDATATGRSTRVSVHGSPVAGLAFNLNGIDNTGYSMLGGGALNDGPNQDAVGEFSVLTHTFSAESGSFPVQVRLETKAGTNSFHGQLRFLHLDPTASARDFFDTVRKTTYRTETGGAQFSGPVTLPGLYNGRNRTLFFFDAEVTRSRQEVTRSATVLSDSERAGDFNALPPAQWPRDPLTGLAFPDGRVPSGRVLPQSRRFVDELMEPATTGRQLTKVYTDRPAQRQITGRVDHRLSENDVLQLSLFASNYRIENPSIAMRGAVSQERTSTHNISLRYTHSLSSRADNSLVIGRGFQHYFESSSSIIGVTPRENGFNITSETHGGYPAVSVGNIGFFDPGGSLFGQDQSSLWTFKDEIAFATGSHRIKAGVEDHVVRATYVDNSFGGTAGGAGFDGANPNGTGNAVADFLLGLPVAYSQNSMKALSPRRNLTGFYFQDDLKLRADVTLNLGLRYDLNFPWHEAENRIAVFRPGAISKIVPSAPAGILYPGDVDPIGGKTLNGDVSSLDRTNWGPRVGMAYAPAGSHGFLKHLVGGPDRSSIRAGYGIYYVTLPQQSIYKALGVPPWTLNIALDAAQLANSGGTFLNPWGSGPDPFTLPVNDRTLVRPLGGLSYVEPQAREVYQQQWSLSVSRELPGSMALSVSYVGSSTVHLLRQHQANPGLLTPSATVNNVEGRRQYYPDFSSIQEFTADGRASYNGLQIEVNRRFTRSFQFNGSYVWSKALDNGGSTLALADRDATPWARSSSDRTHQFIFSGVWALPSPPVRGLRPILSGWRVTSIVELRSGPPLNLRNQFDSTLLGLFSNSTAELVGHFQRLDPREVRTFKLPNGNTATGHFFFDPTAFRTLSPVGPAQARPGNLGRDPFTGLGRENVDLSLTKRISIGEKQSVDLRVDSTNLLNHAQFLPGNLNTGAGLFGQTTRTSGPRRLQFVLKYNF